MRPARPGRNNTREGGKGEQGSRTLLVRKVEEAQGMGSGGKGGLSEAVCWATFRPRLCLRRKVWDCKQHST